MAWLSWAPAIASCGGAPTSGSPRPNELVAPRSSVTTREDADASGAESEDRRPLATVDVAPTPPTDVACVLGAEKFSGVLELRPRGPVYARVSEARASLALPLGTGDASYLTIEGPLTAHGYVDAPRLFLRGATPLGGFVLPSPSTPVDVEPIAEGRIAVSLDVSSVFEDPKRVRDEAACDLVSFVEGTYDAHRVAEPLESHRTGLRASAKLALAPDGAPVARLRRSPRGSVVIVRAVGATRQIVIDAGGFVAFGWVPDEAIAPLDLGASGVLLGRTQGRFMSGHDAHPRRCAHPLTVLAEVEGERAEIGELRAGAAFVLPRRRVGEAEATAPRPGDDPRFEVMWLPGSSFTTVPGARLLVRRADLEGC